MTTSKKIPVGRQIIAGLESKPEFVPKMIAAILTGLDANVRVFTKGDSDGALVPDARARLEAFKLAMAYAEGLPLQRIIQANLNPGMTGVNTAEDLAAYLAESPALMTAFERQLEQAKRLKSSQPVNK